MSTLTSALPMLSFHPSVGHFQHSIVEGQFDDAVELENDCCIPFFDHSTSFGSKNSSMTRDIPGTREHLKRKNDVKEETHTMKKRKVQAIPVSVSSSSSEEEQIHVFPRQEDVNTVFSRNVPVKKRAVVPLMAKSSENIDFEKNNSVGVVSPATITEKMDDILSSNLPEIPNVVAANQSEKKEERDVFEKQLQQLQMRLGNGNENNPSSSHSSSSSSVTSLLPSVVRVKDSEITQRDVLSGRGGGTNHHLGNRVFRKLVDACRPEYVMARKSEKSDVAFKVVQVIRSQGGRFLKKDNRNKGMWYDVGDKLATDKTSQALREGISRARRRKAAIQNSEMLQVFDASHQHKGSTSPVSRDESDDDDTTNSSIKIKPTQEVEGKSLLQTREEVHQQNSAYISAPTLPFFSGHLLSSLCNTATVAPPVVKESPKNTQ